MKRKFLTIALCLFAGLISTKTAHAEEVKEPNYQECFVYDTNTNLIFEQEDFIVVYLHEENQAPANQEEAEKVQFWTVKSENDLEETHFMAKVEDTKYYVISENGINLRLFPNITYDNIVKVLPYGSEIQVLGSNFGWSIVEYENEKYFCWNEYLSVEKPKSKRIKSNPSKNNILIEEEKNEESSNVVGTRSLGVYTLTAYCNCRECCGQWAGGPAANGNMPVAGRTVACNSLSLGTKISINGHIYTVEDRGNLASNVIDIYFDSHSAALSFGRQSAEVFLVE